MDTQNRGIELALLLTLPATIAFLTVAEPILRALFQHGAFGPEDTLRSAQSLAAFSLGLPAYVLIKVMTPGFYAREDTRTPVRFAMYSIVVNIVLNLAFIPTIAHIGPPLATAIAAWVNFAMLYVTLRRRGHFAFDRQLAHRLPRFAIAALLMGGALFFADRIVAPWTTGEVLTRIIGMVALVGAGSLVYGLACLATGAFRLADLRALLPDDVCLFFLADLHALTVTQDPATMASNTIEMAATLLAAGIDPDLLDPVQSGARFRA
ncbi:hypothetical protein SASPL_157688 [Salvia splendens]|uniref:Murein biosynthesis integral membrane protein MurJ n=1 Tax=Salvia splendens TaxID=180675 RepID=A0A8X8VUM1_SALSN|nr:hypothetical protein SASPL_157688 [Salvia splendens]